MHKNERKQHLELKRTAQAHYKKKNTPSEWDCEAHFMLAHTNPA